MRIQPVRREEVYACVRHAPNLRSAMLVRAKEESANHVNGSGVQPPRCAKPDAACSRLTSALATHPSTG